MNLYISNCEFLRISFFIVKFFQKIDFFKWFFQKCLNNFANQDIPAHRCICGMRNLFHISWNKYIDATPRDMRRPWSTGPDLQALHEGQVWQAVEIHIKGLSLTFPRDFSIQIHWAWDTKWILRYWSRHRNEGHQKRSKSNQKWRLGGSFGSRPGSWKWLWWQEQLCIITVNEEQQFIQKKCWWWLRGGWSWELWSWRLEEECSKIAAQSPSSLPEWRWIQRW